MYTKISYKLVYFLTLYFHSVTPLQHSTTPLHSTPTFSTLFGIFNFFRFDGSLMSRLQWNSHLVWIQNLILVSMMRLFVIMKIRRSLWYLKKKYYLHLNIYPLIINYAAKVFSGINLLGYFHFFLLPIAPTFNVEYSDFGLAVYKNLNNLGIGIID